MANCHDLFQDFHKEVSLDDKKKDFLIEARGAIREKIRNYFKKKDMACPGFYGQGSYTLGTIINPIDEEYDIDDGVYLQNLDSDKTKWETPETVHRWIYDAVKGHTKENPIDKRTCVRVVYAGEYHVDLPIYCMHDDNPYLAEKGDAGWHISDARAIVEWFQEEVQGGGEQLQKMVKFFKAWADNKSKSGDLPKSIALTVLIVESYAKKDRDDSSFAATIKRISERLDDSTEILNPVDENEKLSDNITDDAMENLKEKLLILLENASDALKTQDKKEACKKWRTEFGERFSNCEKIKDGEEEASTFPKPAILHDNARSAW